ncbi:NADH:flavin oxidoreductase/NADH oxidase [Streptomyces sp. P01-B04]|uniref:NADH:flavin oxidoreductase/NADH oxidase n=1 Tax=Streptomyces poriferorum TaxID=2798799 RepID=UPI001C5DADAE|nr:NADH:flavin oxidoreductase/NADH oxidase [Streptomyces poriferorum]MBW5250512.1 NADH:flavin oxidoreductase/NADH oxidase [Streptomyces poriferorum]MBW5257711.1 NADH:flavin oxidoreductase/NADH oxidase [Streptomyces poriferorum]
MSALFEPLVLRSLEIRNRVWMAPMCQYSAPATGEHTGTPGNWHVTHLSTRAVGGAGLIMTEGTAVTAAGRITPTDLGLWNDRQQKAFERIAHSLRNLGSVPGIQLAHAGRKASTARPWDGGAPLAPEHGGWRPVGPSPLPYGAGHLEPNELTIHEIHQVIEAFAQAARRALDAGFQVVEVHGAHGYLIHEFLSPFTNQRRDRYGGSFAHRIRFALEVADAVRSVWPDSLPVFFRASATDWLDGTGVTGGTDVSAGSGWTIEDTVRLSGELLARGVDLLDISSGGVAPGIGKPVAPGYQVPFAATVRHRTGAPVSAVGLITDPRQAERIVASGQADAVMLGRELLRNPYWPHQAAKELGGRSDWPQPYGMAAV